MASFPNRLMAAFNALRGKVPQGKAEATPFFYASPISNQSTQKLSIDPQRLRAFSETAIVRRAVDYIRNQVTKLDWDVQAKKGKKLTAAQKKQLEIVKHILENPNADDNWMTWLGQMIEDMLVLGMGTSEVKTWTGQPNHPYLLYPVDAASIQIYLAWDGTPNKPRYAQADYKGHYIDFKNSELLVMKHNPRTNTPFGLSPVEVAFQQIAYLIDAQAYSGKTASSATPKKLLFMGQDITEQQLKEFRQYFRDEIEGRSHLPIVGGTSDAKSVELGASDDNALFLQWQSFLIAIIANAFNLDIMKFNAIVGINRSTGDTLDDVSDEGAIRPMAHSIEHYMNQFLAMFELSDVAEFKFRFTTSFSDRKSLATIHQIYGQLDVLTINEIREEMGQDPLPKDEETGKSKGDLTISEYRAKYGSKAPIPVADDQEGDSQDDSQKSQDTTQDPNNDGGKNGVYGAPKPMEQAFNQRNDKALDVT